MTSQALHSPNFAFLFEHDPMLVRVAAFAERYVFDDANAALFKLRLLGELLARQAAAYSAFEVADRDNFSMVVVMLRDGRVITSEVKQLFDGLRLAGNQAAHTAGGDRREALHQLRMAHKLAVWFQASFGRDRNFKRPQFVPPPDPVQVESELKQELTRLREALLQSQEESQGALASAEEHAKRLAEAELKAQNAYQEQTAALELAAETEQLLVEQEKQFQQKLQEIQTAAAAKPPAEKEAVVQAAHQQAEQVDLDEAATRRIVDAQLREAGWEADTDSLRYSAGTRPIKGRNLAIAEWPTQKGPADYCLFVGLKPVAVVEAKRSNKNCASAIVQAKRYSQGFRADSTHEPNSGPWETCHVPFLFSTNGRPYLRQIQELSGIWFQDARRNYNHPRALEAWYTPEGLTQLLAQDVEAAEHRLETESIDYLPLRDYQANAIREVERKIAAGQRDMLVAMATGTGKTRTCIGLIYRLIKSGRFRRVLFLVDRSALGHQTGDALKDLRLENYQSFSDIYDVKELGDLRPETETKLQIATVQGMVKRLLYPDENTQPIPVDAYDCIVIDECHRGYNLDQEMSDSELEFRSEADYISKYRRVIDHFDAVRIGLTATPALHTSEIFGPPIYQYSYRQAIIDGWLVDQEPPYQIRTKLSEDGILWDKGAEMKVIDLQTNQLELFNTPDEVNFEVDAFNRKVLTENFNREVCKVLTDYIDPSLPGKTLVFCVNDLHADMVVRLLKETFSDVYGPIHDDTIMKITGNADKPLQLIRRFKNEQRPNIVVTVDLLTTGIDVPSICHLVFLRRVKSRILYDQMIGRATRLCSDLYGPGEDKQRFQIFDAVNLYSSLQQVSEMKPVVTNPNITFEQLVEELCTIEDDAYRAQVKDQLIAKLQRKKLSDSQRERLEAATGMSKRELIEHLKDSTPESLAEWFSERKITGSILDDVRRGGTKFVVSDHEDELRGVERGYGTAKKPEDYLEAFRDYVTQHLNDLPALMVVTQRPRDLTRSQLRELRLALDEAGFTEANLRTAWRETTNQDIAATIIGYIRHVACGQPLVAHKERVQAAMKQILESQAWTVPQRKWLERIGKQLEQEVIVDREALDAGQFKQQGGFERLNKIFKGGLDSILKSIASAVWGTAS